MTEEISKKINYNFIDHFTGYDDHKQLFKDIGLPEFKNLEMKEARVSKEKHFSIVTVVDSKTGDKKKILVYGVLGEPTFKQLLEAGYDNGSDIDVRIFMFYHPGEAEFEFMNNKYIAENFVDIFNDCHQDTYLVDIIEQEDLNSLNKNYQFKVITGPDNLRRTSFRKLPLKEEFQQGELWNYYANFIGAYGNPIETEPDYLVANRGGYGWRHYSYGLTITCSWNSNGMEMIAIANDDKRKAVLTDIFKNESKKLKSLFKGSDVHFITKSGVKKASFWLSVHVDKRPISSFFNCSANEKYDVVEALRGYEMKFDRFITEYHEVKAKEKSA